MSSQKDRREYSKQHYHNNKEYYKNKRDQWYRNNKQRQVFTRLKSKFDISQEEFDLLPDHCEVCGRQERLVVDHNHVTNRYRGRLCQQCNTGIGMLQDSPELCRLAADYLERNTN
jgi:hypothetical protein